MEYRMLDLEHAAAHLHMDARELLHCAQRGEIESVRRGEEYLFEHRLLDEWGQRRILALPEKKLEGEHKLEMTEIRRKEHNDFRVAALVKPAYIEPAMRAKNRAGVLRDLTELAESTGLVYDKDVLFRELVAREEASTTAIEGGAALPHARFHDPYLVQESFIAVGRAERPVFYGAGEGEGTDLFFLTCCTDHTLHMHALARLCLLAQKTDLFARLREAADAEAMCAAIAACEEEFLGEMK